MILFTRANGIIWFSFSFLFFSFCNIFYFLFSFFFFFKKFLMIPMIHHTTHILRPIHIQTHTIIHIKNNNRSEQEDVNILSFELNGHIILKKADCFTLISTLKKASRYCWESPASVLRSKTWSKRFYPNYKQITVGSDKKRLISTGYR